ncbi:MAG: LpxL/LpxP family Kdo(2)-lipid IV(A) lauroyl/palmitoleoyl acyltransferase [Moraxellaceae bacterium]|nr:MAG: LpxL/LpxP family Kdo(2)-lipid IV(A) lauroyl/palmitoleoyl acyltransferase [Moraxellaceae bacterium]
MQPPVFNRALLSPRHWPAWIGVGIWFLISQLPYRFQCYLAHLLTPLLHLNKKRVHQARTNLRLCFPELTDKERAALLNETLRSTAMAVFETGIAWFWPNWRLRRIFTITGVEHIEAAQREGNGALLLSMHFTTLDIGSAMLGQYVNYDGMYRKHDNDVYDYMQKIRREAYAPGGTAFSRDNVRGMVSRLRQGRMIWYAPDRDLGEKISIFVPFFGVQTATVTATAQFARMGRAKVIPFTQKRLPNGKGYELTIHPPFENYPTGDEYQDALRVSQFMESEIRKIPGQYFWAQPRFKTRPPGEPSVYK